MVNALSSSQSDDEESSNFIHELEVPQVEKSFVKHHRLLALQEVMDLPYTFELP